MPSPFGSASPEAEIPHEPHRLLEVEDLGIAAAASGGVSKAGPSSLTHLVVAG